MKEYKQTLKKMIISPVMWGFIGFAFTFTIILMFKLAGELTGRSSDAFITINDVILAGYVIIPAFILKLFINLQTLSLSRKQPERFWRP